MALELEIKRRRRGEEENERKNDTHLSRFFRKPELTGGTLSFAFHINYSSVLAGLGPTSLPRLASFNTNPNVKKRKKNTIRKKKNNISRLTF